MKCKHFCSKYKNAFFLEKRRTKLCILRSQIKSGRRLMYLLNLSWLWIKLTEKRTKSERCFYISALTSHRPFSESLLEHRCKAYDTRNSDRSPYQLPLTWTLRSISSYLWIDHGRFLERFSQFIIHSLYSNLAL